MYRGLIWKAAMTALMGAGLVVGCAGTSADEAATETPDPVTPVEPHDFNSDAPWYSCNDAQPPEGVEVVTLLDGVDHFFGSEDRRTVREAISLPTGKNWGSIGMKLRLDCPETGLCDHWDRLATVGLQFGEEEPVVELARYITPYRAGMCTFTDVTELSPILKGDMDVVSFIDTWVGPGHDNGDGWKTSVELWFYPDNAMAGPDEVVNIWPMRRVNVGSLEDGSRVDDQLTAETFTIEGAVRRVEAHLVATGHGFGHSFNCAEFCQMEHTITVNGLEYTVNQWRADCEDNPVSPQAGTWQYDRNGWCPGAISIGDRIDISSGIVPGDNSIDVKVRLAGGDEYSNTSPDGNSSPSEYISLKLYVYR